MFNVIVLKKGGDLSTLELNEKEGVRKSLKKITNNYYEKKGGWEIDNKKYTIYGGNEQTAGNENKHDIPPPYDTDLFFGDMFILKKENNKIY